MLTVNRDVLMSTRLRLSEEVLAELGLAKIPANANILIGGLGMGFTLQAALHLCSPTAVVNQAELVPEIVEWNHGPLAEKNGHAIDDARVKIHLADVVHVLYESPDCFDAIILDVDNGPSAMVSPENASLYSDVGLSACFEALKEEGRLTVWSADDDNAFKKRMRNAGFQVSMQKVRGSRGKGGPRHVIFIGDKIT